MFSAASKLYFTIAVLAVAFGFGSVFATHDRVGMTALVAAGVVSAALGVAVFGFTRREPVGAETVTEAVTVDTADVPAPAWWPLIAAAAVGVLALGAALEAPLVVMGVAIGVIAALGWLGQVWREHPGWSTSASERLWRRYVGPIGLPIVVVVVIAIGAISVSRLLLAIDKDIAVVVATLVAFAILGGGYLISSRPNLGRQAVAMLAVLVGGLVVASGVAGALMGEREFHEAGGEHGGEAEAIELVATDNEFDTDNLDLPAQTEVTIHFKNEGELQHSFSLLEEEGGDKLFTGDLVDGGEDAEYTFTTPEAGSYYFQCDVHPAEMNGDVTITPADASQEPDAEPGENPATTTSTAAQD